MGLCLLSYHNCDRKLIKKDYRPERNQPWTEVETEFLTVILVATNFASGIVTAPLIASFETELKQACLVVTLLSDFLFGRKLHQQCDLLQPDLAVTNTVTNIINDWIYGLGNEFFIGEDLFSNSVSHCEYSCVSACRPLNHGITPS